MLSNNVFITSRLSFHKRSVCLTLFFAAKVAKGGHNAKQLLAFVMHCARLSPHKLSSHIMCSRRNLSHPFRVLWNIRPMYESRAVDNKLPAVAISVNFISSEMTTTDAESMMATAVRMTRSLRETVIFLF